jgi:hypothetical protein
MTFREALADQRWDDHRYYHHSRINQTLHLVSAISFIWAYLMLFVEPALATMIAWLFAMPSRQIGHFFFEPRDYDAANHATHEHKEEIKVGYNLRRKAVLMSIWLFSPLLLLASPTLFGLVAFGQGRFDVLHNVSVIWLTVGLGAIMFRTVHLFLLRDVQTGLVWATKIITDPFHDVILYYKAPMYVLRGDANRLVSERGGGRTRPASRAGFAA